MYSLRIVIRLTKGFANNYSLVFCPRWMFSSDQTSDSTGNKRSLCRWVKSTIFITAVIPWLWLFWPIVRLFHHWILTSSQAFPILHEISSCQVLCMCYICEWPPLNMFSSCYWTLSSVKPHICSSVFAFIVSFILMVRPLWPKTASSVSYRVASTIFSSPASTNSH